jgi:hypothetical protein
VTHSVCDFDSEHYLVVAKVRERLAVNTQRSQRFHMERFNLKKLNEVEGKEKFRFDMSNRFAALEDLDAEVEINSALETIRPRCRWVDNIRIDLEEVDGVMWIGLVWLGIGTGGELL